MDLHLTGKVLIVTGAGSGIGAATGRLLAAEGARVLLADLHSEHVESVAASIVHGGGEAVGVTVDVTNSDNVAGMVDTAVQRWGRLDGAVNNAGIAQPAMPVDRLSEEQFDRLLAVNAKGIWLCLKHEIPAILDSGGGAIVNVTSVASHTATAGQTVYAASKHAALGLTKGAALDYARQGIRITAVSPGLVATPMVDDFVRRTSDPNALAPIEAAHPMGRSATPEEVADAIAWQLSDRAAFTTGSALLVDGGFTAT